jgi:hypothetical protein
MELMTDDGVFFVGSVDLARDFCALRFRGLPPPRTRCNRPKFCTWASSVIAHGPNASTNMGKLRVLFRPPQKPDSAGVPAPLFHANGLCSPACFNFQLSARSVPAISRYFVAHYSAR